MSKMAAGGLKWRNKAGLRLEGPCSIVGCHQKSFNLTSLILKMFTLGSGLHEFLV